MSASFRGKMAQEISDWANVGLITDAQSELLHLRYDPAPFKGTIFLKWLGLFAVFMLGMSFLGFIGIILASFSPLFSTLCLLAISYLTMHYGARLASDQEQKHPFTGQSLLTAGLIGLYASFVAIYYTSGGDRYSAGIHAWFMLLTSTAAFFVAYHFRLRWPLLIALLMFYHGVGSMSEYWGNGAYFLSVQDPRLMSIVALLTIMFGYWHETDLEHNTLQQCVGFGGLYMIMGLLYLNLSLWILSLYYEAFIWILVFTAAGIAQIVAGARFKDSRFTGFGIVFLGIDMYTRFYEFFWDSLSRAAFFSLAGLLAMGLGYAFERQHKQGASA